MRRCFAHSGGASVVSLSATSAVLQRHAFSMDNVNGNMDNGSGGEQRLKGKVLNWNSVKGFGFVKGPEGDVFLHRRDLVLEDRGDRQYNLEREMVVEFVLVKEDNGKFKGKGVTLPGNMPLPSGGGSTSNDFSNQQFHSNNDAPANPSSGDKPWLKNKQQQQGGNTGYHQRGDTRDDRRNNNNNNNNNNATWNSKPQQQQQDHSGGGYQSSRQGGDEFDSQFDSFQSFNGANNNDEFGNSFVNNNNNSNNDVPQRRNSEARHERHGDDFSGRRQKQHSTPEVKRGKIQRLVEEKQIGFIRVPGDDQDYFFSFNDGYNGDALAFDKVEGAPVEFVPHDKGGRKKAKEVRTAPQDSPASISQDEFSEHGIGKNDFIGSKSDVHADETTTAPSWEIQKKEPKEPPKAEKPAIDFGTSSRKKSKPEWGGASLPWDNNNSSSNQFTEVAHGEAARKAEELAKKEEEKVKETPAAPIPVASQPSVVTPAQNPQPAAPVATPVQLLPTPPPVLAPGWSMFPVPGSIPVGVVWVDTRNLGQPGWVYPPVPEDEETIRNGYILKAQEKEEEMVVTGPTARSASGSEEKPRSVKRKKSSTTSTDETQPESSEMEKDNQSTEVETKDSDSSAEASAETNAGETPETNASAETNADRDAPAEEAVQTPPTVTENDATPSTAPAVTEEESPAKRKTCGTCNIGPEEAEIIECYSCKSSVCVPCAREVLGKRVCDVCKSTKRIEVLENVQKKKEEKERKERQYEESKAKWPSELPQYMPVLVWKLPTIPEQKVINVDHISRSVAAAVDDSLRKVLQDSASNAYQPMPVTVVEPVAAVPLDDAFSRGSGIKGKFTHDRNNDRNFSREKKFGGGGSFNRDNRRDQNFGGRGSGNNFERRSRN